MTAGRCPAWRFRAGSSGRLTGAPICRWRSPKSGSASIAERGAVAPGQWDLVLEGVAAGQRLFLSKNRVLLN